MGSVFPIFWKIYVDFGLARESTIDAPPQDATKNKELKQHRFKRHCPKTIFENKTMTIDSESQLHKSHVQYGKIQIRYLVTRAVPEVPVPVPGKSGLF